jgi:hypothetical protein
MTDSHSLPGPHQHLGAQHEAPDVRASEKCLKNKEFYNQNLGFHEKVVLGTL